MRHDRFFFCCERPTGEDEPSRFLEPEHSPPDDVLWKLRVKSSSNRKFRATYSGRCMVGETSSSRFVFKDVPGFDVVTVDIVDGPCLRINLDEYRGGIEENEFEIQGFRLALSSALVNLDDEDEQVSCMDIPSHHHKSNSTCLIQ